MYNDTRCSLGQLGYGQYYIETLFNFKAIPGYIMTFVARYGQYYIENLFNFRAIPECIMTLN